MNEVLDIKRIETKKIIDKLDQHLNVNCISFLSLVDLLQKKLLNKLKGVHAISSLYGNYGRRTRLPYSVSKHALEGAIKCLALEYPDTQFLGYRPGFFKTKLTEANLSKEKQNELLRRIPSKRLGSPEELSNLLLNNIKGKYPYLSGTFITIDGGLTTGGFFEV